MKRTENYLVSIILPAYNEAEMIDSAMDAIQAVMERSGVRYEMIYVNDGSTDNTWQLILAAGARNDAVRGISFSRNFGKEAAIFAGLSEAKGDCAVVMDCDLQHPPEMIPEMVAKWLDGYQVVEGVKRLRGKDGWFHAAASAAFYRLISKASGIDMARASDFKLLDRAAIDALENFPEQHRFFRVLSAWIGFETTTVAFDVQERRHGQTKWSTRALIRYALSNLSSFSTAPMHIVTVLGGINLLLALLIGIQTLVRWAMGRSQEGFTTVILLIMITSSILMLAVGIIGFYIAKIYDQVRGRPKYIVAERSNGKDRGTS